MAEYLAPGVYVEETSFRAKSIEGVGTSTTGFVGPTRTGPVGQTPELLTSLGDFERIYGSLSDLTYSVNYLAHSVRAFFNEGGSRLYVSRAYLGAGGLAESQPVVNGASDAERARFVARFPGDAGNGRVVLREVSAPTTFRTMESAPEGSLLRVGGAAAAQPATIQGGVAPFSVPDGGRLALTVSGTPAFEVVFHGAPAEVFGSDALADSVDLADTNTTFEVTIDGVRQVLTLPVTPTPRVEFILGLNRQIRGGYVRLSDADEAPANRLVVGSDRRGRLSGVSAGPNAELGFATAANAVGSANPANNVGDLARVTPDEINALLAPHPVRASLGTNGRLVLATVATGAAVTLEVNNPTGSVHAELGLTPVGGAVTPAAGTDGSTVSFFTKADSSWRDSTGTVLPVAGGGAAPTGGAELLLVSATAEDRDGNAVLYDEMGFDPRHPRWIGNVLAQAPTRRSDALQNPYALVVGNQVSAFELRDGLFTTAPERVVTMAGGSDGAAPNTAAYEAALQQFEQLEDISIVAAPGSTAFADGQGIQGSLIGHAERRRAYRIAVLDTADDLTVSGAREVRSHIDSKNAALYYPWVRISNPLARPSLDNVPKELSLPPSGFICGIYARNDVQHGVHKAPANEVVRSALRFNADINFAQQEVLNPLGVNCLRYLPGRGYRVWGARTASSDPEWKYVNVTRYFFYLERSIDQGTQWAVFESNGERLWANIRDTISGFLYAEWVSGALLGANPDEAFFVQCGRNTMTQNDLDNGRLICLVGVAALKPAEFVIFRIGQKTADARS